MFKKKKQVLYEFVLKNKKSKYKFGEKKNCCDFVCFSRVLYF